MSSEVSRVLVSEAGKQTGSQCVDLALGIGSKVC